MNRHVLLIPALLLCAACAKGQNLFGDVGTNIASPAAMALDVASRRLYVVNSNSKVLYDPAQGSFQAYDITDPLAPVLIDTEPTRSFSGQIYLDASARRAYVPNRYTSDSTVQEALLYNFNTDETSGDFLSPATSAIDRDAFSIACCYPAGRLWIATGRDELQYVDVGGDMVPSALPLATGTSDGGQITHAEASHVVIIGQMAFISRDRGGVMVVNLDEAGAEGASPVDYFIRDIDIPRGLATDGTLLYVVGEGNIDDEWTRFLLIIDPSALAPNTENASTQVMSRNDGGMLKALIATGQSPQEVLVSTSYAFVTNQDDDTVSAVDLASQAKVADIPVGDQPFSMALYTASGGVDQYLYVGNIAANTISIIDIPTLSVVATYP